MQALVRLPDGTGQTLTVEGMKDACRQAWRIGAKSLVCMDEETWTLTRSDLLPIYAGIVIPDSLPGLEYRPAVSL